MGRFKTGCRRKEEARIADVSKMTSDVKFMSDLLRALGTIGTDEYLLADNYLVTLVWPVTVVTRYVNPKRGNITMLVVCMSI